MATQLEIAQHLDMSDRNVRDLIKRGVLPGSRGPGGLDVDECRVAYIHYMRGIALAKLIHELEPLQALAGKQPWIETAERLPTREDADEIGNLYVADTHDVYQIAYYNVRPEECTHWMPKPRQQPPEPPTAAREFRQADDHTQPAPTAAPGGTQANRRS